LERAAAEARAQEAGAKAKAERRARRLTLALAVAAGVLLAVAGAGWWWRERVQQVEAARVAGADGKVEAALAEAADHLNRNDLPQARGAATRARELLESGASDRWKDRLDDMWADLNLIARVDEIRRRQRFHHFPGGRLPGDTALAWYAEGFARYGFRPDSDPAAVAAHIRQRAAPVRDALLASLDHWWLIARRQNDAIQDWLGAVFQAVETDDWRARVRRAWAQRDRPRLVELAGQPDVIGQSPAQLATLTFALLLDLEDFETALALLRPLRERHPDDFWINLDLALALQRRQQPNYPEALRLHSIACALRPDINIYLNQGYLHIKQSDWDGVIAASRKAIELTPETDAEDHAKAYTNLGLGLRRKGDWAQAEATFRQALGLNPDEPIAHYHLGRCLGDRGRADEALAAYERSAQLLATGAHYAPRTGRYRWDAALIYHELGNARSERQEIDAALAAFDKAAELDPGYGLAHYGRALALAKKGRTDEANAAMDQAIAACEQAIRRDPTLDDVHNCLGLAWVSKGRWDRAVIAYSRAIELNPKPMERHYNLGVALNESGRPDEAIAAYRKAIELNPKLAEAHWNLGTILQNQGHFAEAAAEMELGQQLGAKPGGNPPDRWVTRVQRQAELDAKLPALLDGHEKPATAAEQVEYASVCRIKGLHGASARLYADAFAVEPALATSLATGNRYRAACVAALTGNGPARDTAEGAQWRKQALEWLRADLALWADRLASAPGDRSAVQQALQRWQGEKALAGLRVPNELAKLPESERVDAIRFWADVQELLVRCLASPPGK
jgi:tetratricopeptide (TPR) repeat protein